MRLLTKCVLISMNSSFSLIQITRLLNKSCWGFLHLYLFKITFDNDNLDKTVPKSIVIIALLSVRDFNEFKRYNHILFTSS